MVRIFVHDNLVAAPQPVIGVGEVEWSYAEDSAIHPEATPVSSLDP
jgi:hypothetical protein